MCVLYVGGWRVPERLSVQTVKEPHGKYTIQPNLKLSVISADFWGFFGPIQDGVYHKCYFLWLTEKVCIAWIAMAHFAYECVAEQDSGPSG